MGHRDASRTPIEVRAPDLVVPRASALDRIAREKETLVPFEQDATPARVKTADLYCIYPTGLVLTGYLVVLKGR